MKPSNLLIIMSDEHQARAMGCADHPFVKTPNLDKLAARGTRFSNAYTPSPICVPARAAFATGRPVHQTRLWDNAMPYDGRIPGWGAALQAQNVPVESIGKLHYRAQDDAAGFDTQHIPMHVVGGHGMVWASLRKEEERISPQSRMLGKHIGSGSSPYTEYDASVVERTLAWLKQPREKPWCLYVGLVAPHFPLVCPQEFFDLYPTGTIPDPKLHPNTGYVRHPWVEKQNAFMNSEAKFTSPQERQDALSAYYGLCSWLDYNVGLILKTLHNQNLTDDTTVIYTSDHGDNAGARGLWGKSNMYEESAAVPLIMAGPNVDQGVCDTPVSLLDVSVTITDHFGTNIDGATGRSLPNIIEKPDPERPVFSEYHAAGAVSGAFMLRKGKWKLIRYIGFEDELFDLETDPEEISNIVSQYPDITSEMRLEMYKFCDLEEVNTQAFLDQDKMIQAYGGRDAALALGAPGATPVPKT